MVALSTIGNVGVFCRAGGGGGGENLVKPLEAKVTTDYKLNPSMALLPGFEPRQHYELLIHCLASLYTVFAPQS